MFTITYSKRIALALAAVFALAIGAVSANEFTGDRTQTASPSVTEINKYMSDHGGFGPEADMPFMPGSN